MAQDTHAETAATSTKPKKSKVKVAPAETDTAAETTVTAGERRQGQLLASEAIVAGYDVWDKDGDVADLTTLQRALIRPGLMQRINTDEALKALRDDIMDNGVNTPIVVIQDKDSDNATFVVDGRRRTIATRLANQARTKKGLPEIQLPCIYLDANIDPSVVAGLVVSLDEIRKEDTIDIKAAKAAHLAAPPFNMKAEQIARRFGVTAPAVRDWLAYNTAAAPVKKAVERGVLSATAAAQLAKAHPDQKDQKEALAKLVEKAEADAKGKNRGKGGKVRVSAAAATSKKTASKAAAGGDTKLSHAFLRSFVEFCEEYESEVSKDDVDVIKIVLGEKAAKSRKGWAAVMKQLQG